MIVKKEEKKDSLEYFHRVSYGFQNEEKTLFKEVLEERKNIFNLGKTIYHKWGIYNIIPIMYQSTCLLIGEIVQKGKAFLHCKAKNYYKFDSPCGTFLISNGAIFKENQFMIRSEFIIPETIYDPEDQNPDLPNESEKKEFQYYTLLSKQQIPLERYGFESRGYYSQIFKTFETMFGKRIGINVNCQALENQDPYKLKKLLKNMFSSSSASKRINIPKQTFKPCDPLNTQNPLLYPVPVEDCEIYKDFFVTTDKDLKEDCSFSYMKKQMELFENGTCHVLNGEINSGFVCAFYLEGIKEVKKEMFYKDARVKLQTFICVTYYTLASLYPPEDEEKFRRYGVCTSPLRYFDNVISLEGYIDITNSFFSVYPDPTKEDFYRPYCVFYVPFHYQINNSVNSYVKYLPNDQGEMIDVQSPNNYNVYTQVKMIVNFISHFQNPIPVLPEFADKVRVLVGTPSLSGDFLNSSCCLPIQDQWVTSEETFITSYPFAAEGYNLIFNDICQILNLSCSPSDFKVNKTKTKKKKTTNKVKEFVLIQYSEATCYRLNDE